MFSTKKVPKHPVYSIDTENPVYSIDTENYQDSFDLEYVLPTNEHVCILWIVAATHPNSSLQDLKQPSIVLLGKAL